MARELYDLHSHILPGMDDGCKTPEESLKLLKESYAQGVRRIFATPHYYPVEPVEEFLSRRDKAFGRLMMAMAETKEPLPEICLGAEVAYRPGLGYEPDIAKLCLGKSRYLLLEMPFAKWGSSLVLDVSNICNTRGLIPVIAHIERYLQGQSPEVLRALWEQDILVQMNAGYLLNFWTRRKGLGMLNKGTVHLLGSDAHNMTSRPQNLGEAVEWLEKKGGPEPVNRVSYFGRCVWDAAKGK